MGAPLCVHCGQVNPAPFPPPPKKPDPLKPTFTTEQAVITILSFLIFMTGLFLVAVTREPSDGQKTQIIVSLCIIASCVFGITKAAKKLP